MLLFNIEVIATEVLWSSSWIHGSLWCIHLYLKACFFNVSWFSFPFSSTLDFFMCNSVGVSRNAKDAYPTGVPDPCSKFSVESELLITFGFITLYVLFLIFYALCCVCLVFVPGLHSFNLTRFLVPLVTFIFYLHVLIACFWIWTTFNILDLINWYDVYLSDMCSSLVKHSFCR